MTDYSILLLCICITIDTYCYECINQIPFYTMQKGYNYAYIIKNVKINK